MIFGRKKRRQSLTFKNRVDQFWEWFSEIAERVYQSIEEDTFPKLQVEFSRKLDKLFPDLVWVFGPGENGVGHSFTLSAQANLSQQFLTSFWLENAVDLPGWTFYSTRQPSGLSGDESIAMDGQDFPSGELLIDATANNEEEKVDIKAWHPTFANCDEEKQYTILFLWLDEALGEEGTQSWIGEIEISQQLSPKSVPVHELKKLVDNVAKACEWEKLPPNQTYSMYELPEQSNDFPRADTIAGATANMPLISEFLNSGGQMENVLEGSGAEFVYLAVDRRVFPDGEEVDARCRIEDHLNETLQASFSGRTFGGAFGMSGAYIDLVIFDGQQSQSLINQAMDQLNLNGQYSVHSFAHG